MPPTPPPPPHDIDAALGKLDLAGEDRAPDVAWLEKSWAEPEAFAAGLFAYVTRTKGPLAPRSRLDAHYDLYQNLVARHAVTDGIALRAWDARGSEATLGYAALHAAAGAWAGAWLARGAAAGDVVVLLLPMGVNFVIALAAALRRTCLPPQIGRGPAGSQRDRRRRREEDVGRRPAGLAALNPELAQCGRAACRASS